MTAVVAFELKSPNTLTGAPFFIGQAFKKGDIPTGTHLHVDSEHYAITPLCYWNDGSVKHAAVTGRVNLSAGVARQVNVVVNTQPAATGTALTASDIQTANPAAVVTLGAFGSVSLTGLLGSPDRTFISTKEMVECHYHASVGADPSLYVIFHVRLFATGDVFVRAIVGNSYFNSAEQVQKDYIPDIAINGSTVWNNSGATYHHSRWARYDITGWIGTDPQITPKHDTGYLSETKLVPNYWQRPPAQSAIDFYLDHDSYVPGDNLNYTVSMGAGGFQRQIGLLTMWDALYLTSGANETMLDSVLAHARAINSYAIAVPDTGFISPPKISDYPDYSINGQNQGGSNSKSTVKQDNTTSLTWEIAHFPSAGYLAYLLTADFYYFESCYFNAILPYWYTSPLSGEGFDRLITGQNRGRAWAYRSASQACAIMPDSATAAYGDIRTWFKTLMAHKKNYYVDNAAASAWIGYEDLFSNRIHYDGSLAPNGEICTQTAPWEHHFTAASVGMASDIEPIDATGMASLDAFRDFLHGAPVWILGGDASTEYNFGYASNYTVNIRLDTPTLGQFEAIDKTRLIATNAGMIIADTESTDTIPFVNGPNNTLQGSSSEQPGVENGYWGNLLPAIAYAVDHNKAGASTSWARITGAGNFNLMQAAPYDDAPVWGIVPRSYSQPAAMFTAEDNITVSLSGVRQRWDAAEIISGKSIWGGRGLGVLAEDIPSTGQDGPGFLYPSLELPADNGKEIRGHVLTFPESFAPDEYSSFVHDPATDGTRTATVQIYADGVAVGSPITVSLNVGAAAIVEVSSDSLVSLSVVTAGGHTKTLLALANGTASISVVDQIGTTIIHDVDSSSLSALSFVDTQPISVAVTAQMNGLVSLSAMQQQAASISLTLGVQDIHSATVMGRVNASLDGYLQFLYDFADSTKLGILEHWSAKVLSDAALIGIHIEYLNVTVAGSSEVLSVSTVGQSSLSKTWTLGTRSAVSAGVMDPSAITFTPTIQMNDVASAGVLDTCGVGLTRTLSSDGLWSAGVIGAVSISQETTVSSNDLGSLSVVGGQLADTNVFLSSNGLVSVSLSGVSGLGSFTRVITPSDLNSFGFCDSQSIVIDNTVAINGIMSPSVLGASSFANASKTLGSKDLSSGSQVGQSSWVLGAFRVYDPGTIFIESMTTRYFIESQATQYYLEEY